MMVLITIGDAEEVEVDDGERNNDVKCACKPTKGICDVARHTITPVAPSMFGSAGKQCVLASYMVYLLMSDLLPFDKPQNDYCCTHQPVPAVAGFAKTPANLGSQSQGLY
ncbi:MAG: hypothetical protein R2932_00640 [Caldilineaceae bacterium]